MEKNCGVIPAYAVCLVTVPVLDQARALARTLLEERLVACVNIVPRIESIYWWDGAIENADEVLLIIKTKQDLVNKLVERIGNLHPYDVPEVLAVSVASGNRDYLQWVGSVVGPIP